MADNDLMMEALEDEDMDNVTGGSGNRNSDTAMCYCSECKKITLHRLASGGRGRCTVCNTLNLV